MSDFQTNGFSPMYPAQANNNAPVPQQNNMLQLPAYSMPSEDSVTSAYDKDTEGGDRLTFLTFPGPGGDSNWSNAPINYEARVMVYLLPAPAVQPGQQPDGIFEKVWSHFWKSASKPKGMGMKCPGQNTCLICQGGKKALASSDPQLQMKANTWAKSRSQYWYQVVNLSYPQQHKADSEGKLRPVILQAGWSLHNAIGSIIKVHGLNKVVDPCNGRPIIIIKKKTGIDSMDIEYSAVNGDPMPLPVQAYPILQNLFCLRASVIMPDQEEMLAAIQDIGLPGPTPSMPISAPVPQPAPQVANSWVPTAMAPATNTGPTQAFGGFGAAPAEVAQVPSFGGYSMHGVTPIANTPPINAQPHLLALPLNEALPGGKERCFGHCIPTDPTCCACEVWIGQQCKSNTVMPVSQDAKFLELQAQLLSGK